ncbi:MAG: hypothetical protein IT292_07165 [Deltaproteobacteria bacterium]|nr:hypothetical protein [Deltaproteobacteria bacterium]
MNYNLASSLEARKATGEKMYLPIGHETGVCYSEKNYVDIANVLSSSTSAVLKFRDSTGALKKTQSIALKARNTLCISVSSTLKGTGTVELAPAALNSMLSEV